MDLPALERSTSALEKSLDSWEVRLAVATGLVVVGLILEYWHEVWDLLREKPIKWKVAQKLLGAVLVTVGVAGELGIQYKTSSVETSLRSTSHEIEGALNKEAGDAEDRAAKAEQNVAEANKSAAQANERAAEATLELAKLRTPRTLNHEQQVRISAKLKRFKGTQFDVAVFSDPEADNLLVMIEDALKEAGWLEVDWKGSDIVYTRTNRPVAGPTNTPGFLIQMHPEQAKQLFPAAAALASALTDESVSARAQGGLGIVNTNPQVIHILVGKKPE